jgi:NADH dehydrogenase
MILVAGGTGTLGRLVVARMGAAGHDVRVLTREPSRAHGLAADLAVGDVRDVTSLMAATRGCTVVVSAVHGFLGGRAAGPEHIDHRGNAALVRAAVSAGVQHVVLLSVYDARPNHPMSLHRAKAAAERDLQASGLAWTVLRPTSYVETWIPIVAGKAASGGPALVLGRGANPINFVSVRDVAMLVERAVADPAMRNRSVNVIGSDNLSMTQLAQRLGATRIRHVPRSVLRATGVALAPFAPAAARAARSAVLMDTTNMSADPAPLRAAFPDLPWHAASDVADAWRHTAPDQGLPDE